MSRSENEDDFKNWEINKNPYENSTECLGKSFLNIYEPQLKKVKGILNELTEKQTLLDSQIHQENINLSEVQHSVELHEIFTTIRLYQQKLTNIKREIKSLHEKSTKLKKRALRMQQFKEKEDYLKICGEVHHMKRIETSQAKLEDF